MDSLLFNSINFLFSFLAFISNVVRINGYKLLKQKFFGVFDNFLSIMEFWDQQTWKLVVYINGLSYLCLLFDQEIKSLQEIREWRWGGSGCWFPPTVSLQGHLAGCTLLPLTVTPWTVSYSSLTLTLEHSPNPWLCGGNGFAVTIPRS